MKRLLRMMGLIPQTRKYRVKMRLTKEGWMIVTPFLPAKGPWCYGEQKQVGYEEATIMELVQEESPYGCGFEIEGGAGMDEHGRNNLGQHGRMSERVQELYDALEGMVRQFACWSQVTGGYTTGGLSALEEVFDALGWGDPHPQPDARCDEPGCMEEATCGTPTADGYRRTCGKHLPNAGPHAEARSADSVQADVGPEGT